MIFNMGMNMIRHIQIYAILSTLRVVYHMYYFTRARAVYMMPINVAATVEFYLTVLVLQYYRTKRG